MKNRLLPLLCVCALCLSLLSVGLGTLAGTADITYKTVQNFESAAIGNDCYTFSQFQSSAVLTYAPTTAGGSQAVELTVSAQNGGGDNFYPALTEATKDWTGYDGLTFYYKAGECPVVHSGGLEVGRFDIVIDLDNGTRLTATNTVGPMYFLEDGATEEIVLLTAGDQRYILPNKSGYIRMPFTSLSGWTKDTAMTVREMYLWFAADAYTGNHYILDALQLYGPAAAGGDSEGDENNDTAPLSSVVLQDFEAGNAGETCYTFSQFQGAGNEVLTYALATDPVNTGSQSLKLTVHAAGSGWDNFYPQIPADKKDWTDYAGLLFYYAAVDCPTVYNGNEVGRFEIAVETTAGVRYTSSAAVGDVYFTAAGSTTETALEPAGDNRYKLPPSAGLIRVPFTSLANWNTAQDMSAIKEAFLSFATADYVGNVYCFDTVAIYAEKENPDPDQPGEGGGENPDPDQPGEGGGENPDPDQPGEDGGENPDPDQPGEGGGENPDPDQPGEGEGEEKPLDPVVLQDFESATAGDNSYTFSQFQTTGNVLTYVNVPDVHNTGNQAVQLTVKDAGPGWDNYYPVIHSKTDWTGYNTLTVYFKPGDCPFVYSENEVGRFEFAMDTVSGTRFAANSTVGNLYFLADDTEEEVPLEVAADGRFKLPNKAGIIRIPFASLAGWTSAKDLSAMKELYLSFATADYVGNNYYFDTLSLCVVEDGSGDAEEEGEVPPLMIQNFEKKGVGSCMYRWNEGAGAELSLVEGIGVDGSKAGKLTIGAPNGSQVSLVLYVLMQNTDLSAGKTLMFYAENPQTDEEGYVSLAFTLEESDGERWGVGSNKKFYLVSADGEVKETRNGSDMRMVIPAGFKGWVIVPQNSLSLHMNSLQDGERNFSDLSSLLIDAAADMMQGKSIYLDNICMSELAATAVLEQLAPEQDNNQGGSDNEGGSNAGNGPGSEEDDSPATGEKTTAATVLALVALAASMSCRILSRKCAKTR